MKAGEIKAAKIIIDEVMPEVLKAECERLPAAYQPIAQALVSVIAPAIQTALDAKLAALPVDAGSVA